MCPMALPSVPDIILENEQRNLGWFQFLKNWCITGKIKITIFVTDTQVVGEVESTLFSMIQQGPVSAQVIIKNTGVNTMNYRFQEYNGSAWVDLGASGSAFYNTLSADEVKVVTLTSSYPQVRMVGNASGGAYLDFDVTRYVERPSGSALPILSL